MAGVIPLREAHCEHESFTRAYTYAKGCNADFSGKSKERIISEKSTAVLRPIPRLEGLSDSRLTTWAYRTRYSRDQGLPIFPNVSQIMGKITESAAN